MDRRQLSFVLLTALLTAALVVPVRAHDVPLEVVTYVKVEGPRVLVLARVPIALLTDAHLPTRPDGFLDLQAIDGPLRAVAGDVAKNLDVMDGERPLPMPSAAWAILPRDDASFDTYDAALARFAAPRPPVDVNANVANANIDPGKGLVDLRFEYPTASAEGHFSVRFNGLRLPNRAVHTRVRYVTAAHVTRTFTVAGGPQRVYLEPAALTVASQFARLGVEQLAQSPEHLVFLLCLVIPPRRIRTVLGAFGAFAAGYVVALVASALMLRPMDLPVLLAVQTAMSATLVAAALQNVTAPRLVWVRIVSGVFGLVDGASFASAYSDASMFAGPHTLLSLVSFAAPVVLGSLWLLLIVQPVVGLAYRWGLPERIAIILLSAIPVHAGLHGVLDRGPRLLQLDVADSDPALFVLTRHWQPFLLALGLTILVAIAGVTLRAGRSTPRSGVNPLR
jgi:hypothetical protein